MNLEFFDTIRQRATHAFRILQGDAPISSADLEQVIIDQLGHGWQDRLDIINKDLSPENVNSIINNASSRTYGNIGALYELMYKVTLDPRVGGMVDKRTEAVTKCFYDVKSANKDNPLANEATEFVHQWIESIKFKEFLSNAMDAKLYGITAFQNVIFRDGDKYIFDDPNKHQISQSRWRQGTNQGTTKEDERDSDWGKPYIVTKSGVGSFASKDDRIFIDNPDDIHPMRLSIFRYKRKRGYYDKQGLMSRILRLYILKIYMLKFWANLAERNGKPFIYALLQDNNFKDDDFKGQIKTLLKQFGAERWGIFPKGLDIEHLDTSSATASDIYLNLLNFANLEMTISLLGQNLSTEVQGGSYSATQQHAEVEEGKTEGDLEFLEENINDNTLYWLVKPNFPNLDESEYPNLSLTARKNINVQQEAMGLKAVSEIVDIPTEEVYARTQVRPPRLKEDAEDATGADRYDEDVVGPSTRRSSRLDQIARTV